MKISKPLQRIKTIIDKYSPKKMKSKEAAIEILDVLEFEIGMLPARNPFSVYDIFDVRGQKWTKDGSDEAN